MSFVCRRGHHSISDDFCDVCGAKNRDVRQTFTANAPRSTLPPAGPAVHPCPVCSTPRDAAGEYCLSCGYDFVTGERFGPIIPTRAPALADVPVQAPAPAPPAALTREPAVTQRLVVVVSVDPERADQSQHSVRWPDPWEHVFNLVPALLAGDGRVGSMVIGRADAPGVQVPIRGDPYVSRQHAEIVEVEGGWAVRDLGSTNGTRVNGAPLVGPQLISVAAGDVIELGCCSRLTVLPAQD
jgi:hypothetical protein